MATRRVRESLFRTAAVLLVGCSGALAPAQGQEVLSGISYLNCFNEETRTLEMKGSASFTLTIENCEIRAEMIMTTELPAARANLRYRVDLAKQVFLKTEPFCQGTVWRFAVTPAVQTSRRIEWFTGKEWVPNDEVPLFLDDDTTLYLLVDPLQFSSLRSSIESARDRCQGRAVGSRRLGDEDIARIAKQSIVYIAVEGETRDGLSVETNGTGFLIDGNGFLITAEHILRDPKSGEPFYRIRKLTGVIGGGRSTSHEIPLQQIDKDERHDVALLKLDDVERKDLSIVACKDSPRTGSKLIAYGFPFGSSFAATPGNFSHDSGPQGRWLVTSAFTHGMSGGPVYDDRGRIRGIVKAGMSGEPAMRWVIPIRQVDGWLRAHNVLIRCGD